MPEEIKCPECGSTDLAKLREYSVYIKQKLDGTLIERSAPEVTGFEELHCLNCQHIWEEDEE